MAKINRHVPARSEDIEKFLKSTEFVVPSGFIDFYSKSNGAEISSDQGFTSLWPLTELIRLNEEYDIESYAPGYFIFGSDGGDTAFVIEKSSGKVFEMPFIGMSNDETVFVANSIDEFLISKTSKFQ